MNKNLIQILTLGCQCWRRNAELWYGLGKKSESLSVPVFKQISAYCEKSSFKMRKSAKLEFHYSKVLAVLLVILSSIGINAKSQSVVSIKIIDKSSGKYIPYASLQMLPNGAGFIADSIGTVKMRQGGGLLYLSAIGYKDTIINGATINNGASFALTSMDYSLEEVVVYPAKMKTVTLGMPRFKAVCGQYILNINQGIVTFIPNRKAYRGYVERISIKIYSKSRWDCPFKLKIMKVDSTFQTVGIPLHKEEIIVQPSKGGWIDVDVSSKKLAIPKDGLLISISNYNAGDCFYSYDKIKRSGYGVGIHFYKKDDESATWWFNPQTNRFGQVQSSWNYAIRAKLRVF